MGKLAQLAAAIEGGPMPPPAPPSGYGDVDPALARRYAATADAIRAGGIPDFMNLWLPENMNRGRQTMKTPGPKEAQIRALKTTTAPAAAIAAPKASAPAKPATEPKASVAPKETTMRKTASTTKTKARTAVKAKAATSAKKPEAAVRPDGLRAGSKRAQVVDLVCADKGLTLEAGAKALGWQVLNRSTLLAYCKEAGVKVREQEGKDGAPSVFFGTAKAKAAA